MRAKYFWKNLGFKDEEGCLLAGGVFSGTYGNIHVQSLASRRAWERGYTKATCSMSQIQD